MESSFAPLSSLQEFRAINNAAMPETVAIYKAVRTRLPGAITRDLPVYDRTVPGRLTRVTATPSIGGEHSSSVNAWLLVVDIGETLPVNTIVFVEGFDPLGRPWNVLAVVEDVVGPHSFAIAARYLVSNRRAQALHIASAKLDGTWKLNGARSLKGTYVAGFLSP